MKMNYGRLLVLVALVSTPAAMVVFLTLEISNSVQVPDSAIWSFVIVVGALLSSVGIESTGILSGHALERFVRRQEWVRASVVFVLLIVYTSVAMRILWANEMLRYVPLVAAVVYVLAGLIEGVEDAQSKEEAESSIRLNHDIEEDSKENDHRREMENKRLELEAQNKLQIELAKEQNQASIAIAEAKAQASIANAEARKAKAEAEQKQIEIAEEQSELAQEQFECEDCGKAFNKVQGLNAHMRFCTGINEVSKNGVLK